MTNKISIESVKNLFETLYCKNTVTQKPKIIFIKM